MYTWFYIANLYTGHAGKRHQRNCAQHRCRIKCRGDTYYRGPSGRGEGYVSKFITASQFKLPDELLPSLNPEHLNMERRIVFHQTGMGDCNPLVIVQTPSTPRRVRRPRPFSVSPFKSEIGNYSTNNQHYIYMCVHYTISNHYK